MQVEPRLGPTWFIQWILPSVSKSSTLRRSRKTEDSAECVLDDPSWKAISAVADLGHRRWLQLKVTADKSGQCRLIACESFVLVGEKTLAGEGIVTVVIRKAPSEK